MTVHLLLMLLQISQIQNLDFDKNEKSIILDITSSIENNILEMVIPNIFD